jgi:hypothetical protein
MLGPSSVLSAPSVPQELSAVNHVLGDIKGKVALAYMDEILCGTRDQREYIMLVAKILDRFLDAGAPL